jgi:glycosyltransferase involved in cell wall biosynthesis
VTFHGYVDNRLLPPLYSSSWATFIPLWLDAIDPFWDGSLKESLACSTPVIGFNEDANDYSSGCQRLGYLIPPSPETGAKILEEILGHQVHLNEVGRRGREEVLGCCSWDSVIGSLEKVYHSLQ